MRHLHFSRASQVYFGVGSIVGPKRGGFKFDLAAFTCCGRIDRLEVVMVMMPPSGLDVCLHPLAFGS